MRLFLIAAAIALGAAVTPAAASEAFTGTSGLDKVEVGYARHNREHRMWEIRRRQDMQARRGLRGDGRGYGHHRGGPPPWAPAHGRRDRDRW
ncbi:hypothetical protein SAMN05216304_103832 [Bosea sp. OK403]|uniref:hypothetical protein n=1 Tax=Bosea sp. OK403 TaxID=1855286 RepID=UPI0008E8CFA4|nr:hypothetical protein [Bosea sp. OK403]SFI87272.1 hypothetical protein SAMN05216304_103832 [Bosea sp. OK403]